MRSTVTLPSFLFLFLSLSLSLIEWFRRVLFYDFYALPTRLLVPDGYIAKTRKQGKGMLEAPCLAVNPENDSLLHG